MNKKWKNRAVIASVLVLVGSAVFLNWRYTEKSADASKILGESALVSAQENGADGQEPAASDYFATARLSRKQSRDSAIDLLEKAQSAEDADQETLNNASKSLQVLASYTVEEAQIEGLVTAKGYTDCVAFMGEDSISVVVGCSEELDSADVARITDIVLNETDYTAQQVKIMEAN
jgi:stage III sporulation protein AH